MNPLQRFALWIAGLEPTTSRRKTSNQSDTIKQLAVITAAPRWVGALMLAEGFDIPLGWLWWWKPLSALLAVAMAGVEGWAFSYIFEAWRKQGGGKLLFSFAMLAGVIFIIVLTPFIVMQSKATGLGETLSGNGLWLWGAAVASSTIVIVAGVGYAQMDRVNIVAKTVYDELEAQLTDAQDAYNESQRQLANYESLGKWYNMLSRFGTDKQGVIARLLFTANGDPERVAEIAETVGASRGTVAIGQKIASAAKMVLANESIAAIRDATGLEMRKIQELRGVDV